MEEEYANHRLEEGEKEVVLVDDGILKEVEEGQEPKNSEYVKEIDIGDDVSSSSSSEEESQLEENSSEFVEEERLEEKKQEEVCEDLAMVESEKIEEKLTQSLVSNGTKETELAETEEKNEETAGVVDLASEGKLEDLLEESVAVPAGESSNVSEHQNESEIPESTGYQVSEFRFVLYNCSSKHFSLATKFRFFLLSPATSNCSYSCFRIFE